MADPRPEQLRGTSGITGEAAEALRKRSEGFQNYTQQKGRPMSYGHGTPPPEKKKKKDARRT